MHILRNINTNNIIIRDWRIDKNECWAILGRNGSGKQRLTQILSGEFKLSENFFSTDIKKTTVLSYEQQQAFFESELKSDDTDFMDHLDPGTTVKQLLNLNEQLPQELSFLGLEKVLNRGYRLLSSGEGRKTLLAQAILAKPELIILDEPYDSLDSQSKNDIEDFFQDLLSTGETQLLFLLNSIEEISEWHTHVGIMEKGELIAHGLREEILQNPDINALLSFDENKLPAWPEPLSNQSLPKKIIELIDGKVTYGDTVIFDKINLLVLPQQHTLITGKNGSGKSTLLSLIIGDHSQCYGNNLSILDYKRGNGETIWDIKKNIGLVSPDLHRNHRVSGSALDIVLSGFFDSIGLYKTPSEVQIQHGLQWLELVGLKERKNSAYKHLSYGEQRLVLIARALVKQPNLLILDEPTQGLDDVNRHRLLYFLDHLASQTTTTIVMVSHRQDEHLSLFKQTLSL